MSVPLTRHELLPSLIDRLIDHEPGRPGENFAHEDPQTLIQRLSASSDPDAAIVEQVHVALARRLPDRFETQQGVKQLGGAGKRADKIRDLVLGVMSRRKASQAQSLRELKSSVRRDLEWLLNTRRTAEEPPAGAQYLPKSVYFYGLPDTTNLALSSAKDQQGLTRAIETIISYFEPRLMDVSVTMLEVVTEAKQLRFQIEALLKMEPAPERVFFDTTLETVSGQYAVEADPRAI